MSQTCPKCSSDNIYPDRDLWVCAICAHEWREEEEPTQQANSVEEGVFDANGQRLQDGDAVTLIKDLKVKGASGALKSGTKIRNIRLIDPIDGHNFSCKVDGFGALNLKSEFVRKA
jgi:protein PhnA